MSGLRLIQNVIENNFDDGKFVAKWEFDFE